MSEDGHVHNYAYRGIVYAFGERLPGSGAREVHYYDHYYCTLCLDCEYKRLDFSGSSYDQVRFGASPAPIDAKLGT